VLVLLRCNARRVMGQHENRHLKFVVADVRVGVPHLERPSPHKDRTSLLDSVLHVSGVSERRQVGIEATCVAILVGYNPSSETVIPTTTFANSSSVFDYVDPSFSGLSPKWVTRIPLKRRE
jgi:hypothetical protein